MSKKFVIWLFVGILLLALLFIIVCYFVSNLQIGQDSMYLFYGNECKSVERLNTVYVALGAFFTACFFGATTLTILYQYRTTLRATSLDSFTRIFTTMQEEPQFIHSMRFIQSNLEKELKEKSIENNQKLEDVLESIKTKYTTKNAYLTEKVIETNALKSIVYFCDKMDYIGILIRNHYVDMVLLYKYGGEISKCYDILENISYFQSDYNKGKYLHLRYLNSFIRHTQKKYDKYCVEIENKIVQYSK